jgi:hypothetical protein
VIAGRGSHEVMSPGHDDEILPADFIDRRIGLTAGCKRSCQSVVPVSTSMARIRLSVAAAMKTSLAAVTTAPPLFGVPFAGLAIAQRKLLGAWNRFCQLAR